MNILKRIMSRISAELGLRFWGLLALTLERLGFEVWDGVQGLGCRVRGCGAVQKGGTGNNGAACSRFFPSCE
jgi:hypothetical protein